MRGHARTDANQPEIVAYLRKRGATVTVTSAVGQGFPDLAVGYRGFSLNIEIKDGKKPPGERKLTPDQIVWHGNWVGHKAICESIEDAEAILQGFDQRLTA